MDILANQHSFDENEIFQLEYVGGHGFNSFELTLAVPPDERGDAPASPTGPVIVNPANGFSDTVSLATGFWRLRTRAGRLWRMAAGSPVQNSADDKNSGQSESPKAVQEPIVHFLAMNLSEVIAVLPTPSLERLPTVSVPLPTRTEHDQASPLRHAANPASAPKVLRDLQGIPRPFHCKPSEWVSELLVDFE
ncbi:unnamed protein product [Protopolystoma xenopodis]|uniref:Uncharacterized protein n=1 Tax=Protopolystoma xenopodis TaxID=117903 RepID=A0A448WLH0_9PLAT|nr:unnamed protein product [Protopolystoma xenopodis]